MIQLNIEKNKQERTREKSDATVADSVRSATLNTEKRLTPSKLLMGIHLRATGLHLPYGITQCYLPPDTSERAPP